VIIKKIIKDDIYGILKEYQILCRSIDTYIERHPDELIIRIETNTKRV